MKGFSLRSLAVYNHHINGDTSVRMKFNEILLQRDLLIIGWVLLDSGEIISLVSCSQMETMNDCQEIAVGILCTHK